MYTCVHTSLLSCIILVVVFNCQLKKAIHHPPIHRGPCINYAVLLLTKGRIIPNIGTNNMLCYILLTVGLITAQKMQHIKKCHKTNAKTEHQPSTENLI